VSSPAGLLAFPLLGTVTDASGGQHPAYHDGQRWNPIGDIILGYVEQAAPVTVANGATVTVASVDVVFAGVGTVCRVTMDAPEVDFTDTSGGEALFLVNAFGADHALGHMHGDRSLGWPARIARRLGIAGAGTVTFALRCRSVSGNLTLRADADTLYGPIALVVEVVG